MSSLPPGRLRLALGAGFRLLSLYQVSNSLPLSWGPCSPDPDLPSPEASSARAWWQTQEPVRGPLRLSGSGPLPQDSPGYFEVHPDSGVLPEILDHPSSLSLELELPTSSHFFCSEAKISLPSRAPGTTRWKIPLTRRPGEWLFAVGPDFASYRLKGPTQTGLLHFPPSRALEAELLVRTLERISQDLFEVAGQDFSPRHLQLILAPRSGRVRVCLPWIVLPYRPVYPEGAHPEASLRPLIAILAKDLFRQCLGANSLGGAEPAWVDHLEQWMRDLARLGPVRKGEGHSTPKQFQDFDPGAKTEILTSLVRAFRLVPQEILAQAGSLDRVRAQARAIDPRWPWTEILASLTPSD